MSDLPPDDGLIPIGTRVEFAKTIGESDIYLFAGITGDFSPNHVNAEYMKTTPYGGIIAHGVLVVGLMSTCSTKVLEYAISPPSRGLLRLRPDSLRQTGTCWRHGDRDLRDHLRGPTRGKNHGQGDGDKSAPRCGRGGHTHPEVPVSRQPLNDLLAG